MNYIAATNHSDALPLNDTDRRWFVLFTQFASVSDLENFLEQFGGRHKYFADLREAIEGHVPALRRWLLDYPISEAFKPNGPPLLTDEKGTMAANSLSDEEQTLAEIIKAGGIGITPKALLSGCLTQAWALYDTDTPTPQTNTLSRLLIKAGWMKFGTRQSWRGKPHYLWTRGAIPNDWKTVKARLDKTLPVGSKTDDEVADLFAD